MKPFNHIREADKAEITRLRNTFGITETIISDLKSIGPILASNIDPLLDDFYAGILADAQMAQLFQKPDVSHLRAKAMQRIHWLDWVFAAKFDTEYLIRCKRIGLAHKNHGILPVFYLYGYQRISQAVKNLIDTSTDDTSMANRLTIAVDKAIFLDISIAVSVYCTEMSAEWRRSSLFDDLTNILNRRGITERLADIIPAAQQDNKPMTVALLDIDKFKRINDLYGHDAGDQVLKFVAQALKGGLRDDDIVGRWGGEEFIIFLPATTKSEATSTCNRLLYSLEKSQTVYNNQAIFVTASIGLSEIVGQDISFEAALSRADQALYQAKNAGRNQVATA